MNILLSAEIIIKENGKKKNKEKFSRSSRLYQNIEITL